MAETGKATTGARRGGRSLRVKPLTPEFWPDDVERPYLRLALAVVLAPALLAVAAGLAAAGVYHATMPVGDDPWLRSTIAGEAIATLFLVLGALAGGVATPALWALRLRGPGAWALTGAAAGAMVAAGFWASGGDVSVAAAAVLISLGALTTLSIRALAGVRTPRRRRR